jgi:hypothetical protein
MNLWLILYGCIALAVVLGGVNFAYGKGTLAAGLYAVGSVFLLITYGLRWFSEGAMLSSATVQWPPVINTCPDYLTHYKRKKADGTTEETCVDTIGVARNPEMLMVFPASGTPDDDRYYFSLVTAKADTAGRNKELCQRAIQYGLTWEGVTNGESCILPDGSKATAGSSGSGSGSC